MKRIISLLIITILTVSCFAGCKSSENPTIDPSSQNTTTKPTEEQNPTESRPIVVPSVSDGSLGFTDFDGTLIAYLNEECAEENYMFSPASLKMALLLAAAGANGNTLDEMLDVVGYENLDDYMAWAMSVNAFEDSANEYFADKKNDKWTDKNYDAGFSIANSIWHNTDWPGKFLDGYKSRVEQLGATFDAVPGDSMKDEINAWINEQTHGMIPEFFKDSLAQQSNVLVNTLYLKNHWRSPFDEYYTKDGDFTTIDGSVVTKEMMEQTDTFKHYEDEDCQILIMRMDGGFNMAIVLGDNSDITSKLSKASYEDVHVVLPKFEIESTFHDEIKQFLIDSGMVDAFIDGETSDFSNMMDVDVVIRKVIQKTKLEVNESGLKAAAVTTITMENDSCAPEEPEPPIDFIADQPFTFYIYAEDDGLASLELLFYGQHVK